MANGGESSHNASLFDPEEDPDTIVKYQLSLTDIVKRELTNFRKDGAARRTKQHYDRRLCNINQHYSDFQSNHRRLVRLQLNATDPYYENECYDEFQNRYLDATAAVQTALDALNPYVRIPINHVNNGDPPRGPALHINLPKAQIPTFNGDFDAWQSFHDLYTASIHNNVHLSPALKFQYLKGYLTDTPALLIKYIDINDESYPRAWQTLLDNYEKKRALFNHHMGVFSDQPSLKTETANDLKQLLHKTEACVHAIKKLGVNTDENGHFLVYFIQLKLPRETRAYCEDKFDDANKIPTWPELSKALTSRINLLEALQLKPSETKVNPSITSTSSTPQSSSRRKLNESFTGSSSNNIKKGTKSFHVATKHSSCALCNSSETHSIRTCIQFLNLAPSERKSTVERLKLCFNCLGYNHHISGCPSTKNCTLCKGRHHTLIHVSTLVAAHETNVESSGGSSAPKAITPLAIASTSVANPINLHVANNTSLRRQVLLATAIIYVHTSDGQITPLRALIDPGSQATLITERAVQCLRLQKFSIRAQISGLGDTHTEKSKNSVSLRITSSAEPTFNLSVDAFVLTTLTRMLPSYAVKHRNWPHLLSLKLADPDYHVPGNIDILLGADAYSSIIREGLHKGNVGEPIAQNTVFGWILSGESSDPPQVNTHTNTVRSFNTHVDIEDLMRTFMELEDVPQQKSLSAEDKWADEFFKSTPINVNQTASIWYGFHFDDTSTRQRFLARRSIWLLNASHT